MSKKEERFNYILESLKGVSEEIANKKNKRTIKYWEDTDVFLNRLGKEYSNAFKSLEKEFYSYSNKYGKDGKLDYNQKRVLALMKEIKPIIDDLYDNQQVQITDLLMNTYTDNYYKGLYEVSTGLGISTSFTKIDKRAVETAIAYPFQGDNFKGYLGNDKNKLILTLKREITQSLIRGDSPVKTSVALASKMNISRNYAQLVVHNSIATILTSSDRLMYDEFGATEYEYVATLDNRTSPVCKELDGQVFPVNDMRIGLNAPPMHPRCRSTTVPYIGDSVGKRISRNLNTNKVEYVPSNMSYKEWEKKFIKGE